MTLKEKDRLEIVEDKVDNMEHTLDEILLILKSNADYNQKGVVEKVSDISRDLSELLVREKVYKAKASTWGVIGGAVVTGILWLGKFLITKII